MKKQFEYLYQNPAYLEYLRYHPSWYKILYYQPERFEDFIQEANTSLKLRPFDKIEKMKQNIGVISSFIEYITKK